MDPAAIFSRIVSHLQATQFGEIAGARFFATIPIAETLLNQLVRETMPQDLPVRDVSIHPEDGNRLSVRLVPRMTLIPAITLKLSIESQPQIPTSPVLVLRMLTVPGILSMAGGAMERMLPPGVRLQGETISVDLQEMARQRGLEQAFDSLRQLRVTTDAGRVLLTIEAGVR